MHRSTQVRPNPWASSILSSASPHHTPRPCTTTIRHHRLKAASLVAQFMNMFLPLGALAEDDVADLQDFLHTNQCIARDFIGFEGMTLLHHAAQQGSEKVAAWLVHPHQGLDLNALNVQGCTVLFIAASTGRPGSAGVVKILLKALADPSIPTLSGSTALMVARSAEVLQLLLHHPEKVREEEGEGGKRGEEEKAVIEEREGGRGGGGGGQEGAPGSNGGKEETAEGGGRGVVREGAQTRVDINAQGRDGHTALHCAMFGRLKAQWALPLLLAHGANPWIKDNRGKYPVYYLGHSRPFSIENLLQTAMINPPPRVWSLCKARAAGEVEDLEDGEGWREGGKGGRGGGRMPLGGWGLCKTHITEGKGSVEAGLIGEEEEEWERGDEEAAKEGRRSRKGRVLCSVEGRAKRGEEMPRVVWREGNEKEKEDVEEVEAMVRFVVGGRGGRAGREGGRGGLPTELFVELVVMMDWQGRDY